MSISLCSECKKVWVKDAAECANCNPVSDGCEECDYNRIKHCGWWSVEACEKSREQE